MEKPIWVTREVKIKAKGKNRKRPSALQKKNGSYRERKRTSSCPTLSGA
jgi:hypothetical protein